MIPLDSQVEIQFIEQVEIPQSKLTENPPLCLHNTQLFWYFTLYKPVHLLTQAAGVSAMTCSAIQIFIDLNMK